VPSPARLHTVHCNQEMQNGGRSRGDPRRFRGARDAFDEDDKFHGTRVEPSPWRPVVLTGIGALATVAALWMMGRYSFRPESRPVPPVEPPRVLRTDLFRTILQHAGDAVLVEEDVDSPDEERKSWEEIVRNREDGDESLLRLPRGTGQRLADAVRAATYPSPDPRPVEEVEEGPSRAVADDEPEAVSPGLLPLVEPGVWDHSLLEEFSANWPSDQMHYTELMSIMRAVKATRLARGGLSDTEVAQALTRPAKGREQEHLALRQRAKGIAILSFGVYEDLMLWAEANPGGLVVAVDAQQWWNEEKKQWTVDFMGACEEAKVCCAVATAPWHTKIETHGSASFMGQKRMVIDGVVVATEDGFEDLHVGGKRAEEECRAWQDGSAGKLPWRFDVAIIRAPHAYNLQSPGRMASIATTAQVVRPGAHVFVRNVARDSERMWSEYYFGRVPDAALPPPDQEAVTFKGIHLEDQVVVPATPGTPRGLPALGDDSFQWTEESVRILLGRPTDKTATQSRGQFIFLGLVELLGHFRVPGRVVPQ
jgi:hypothetical protein